MVFMMQSVQIFVLQDAANLAIAIKRRISYANGPVNGLSC